MTTKDTAGLHKMNLRKLALMAACLSGLGIAGCETSSSLLGSNASAPVTPGLSQPAVAQSAPQANVRIAVAPVIGPPDGVSKALVSQLTSAAERQKIAIATSGTEPVSYTLRGYFVAPTKDKSSNKLSYIWDVTDPAGKRVNRITGEEVLSQASGNDPWGSVTPQIMQTISDKTATSLAAWLPTQSQAGVPVASATPAVVQGALPPPSVASAQPVSAGATGSLPNAMLSLAPRVSGAPGDGNTSLAAAMRRELEDKGIQVAEAGATAYRVAADVKIKPPKDGMQAIAINWTINDPKGSEVAKITQNNEVPAGFLDKSWGPSAEDAAKAASVQIKQVITDHRAGKQIQSSAGGSDRKVN